MHSGMACGMPNRGIILKYTVNTYIDKAYKSYRFSIEKKDCVFNKSSSIVAPTKTKKMSTTMLTQQEQGSWRALGSRGRLRGSAICRTVCLICPLCLKLLPLTMHIAHTSYTYDIYTFSRNTDGDAGHARPATYIRAESLELTMTASKLLP